jgi:hypothetical protein
VVSEIAVAFMLLVASGLMLSSLSRLLDIDAGVDPRNLRRGIVRVVRTSS